MANLISLLILEHQKAALGVLQSYGSRLLFMEAIRKRDLNKMMRHLVALKANNPEIDTLFVTDPEGTLWANYPVYKENHGKNFSHREWYQGLRKEGKPYISCVFTRDVPGKDLAVSVCVPISDEKGQVIGILGSFQHTVFLSNLFRRLPLDRYTHITFIDQKGQIIFSTKFTYQKELTDYPHLSILKKAMEGKKEHFEVREGFNKTIAAYSPLEGIGWSAIVEIENKDILRSQYGHFALVFGISLISFFLLTFALVYLRKDLIFRQTLDRLQTEEALRESQEKYRSLFMGSRDAIYISTREGNLLDFNPSALELFGYTREEMLGLKVQSLYAHSEDRAKFQDEIEKKGFVKNYEIKFRQKNGAEMECLLSSTLRKSGDGQILGYQGIIHDITERKRAEAEKTVLEEQLQQAQKMEAVGRLAGGIAHDFNNLLTVIKVYSQLALLELKDGVPLRGYVEEIQTAANRSADLVQQLLAFSRRQVMEMKVLDLNALLRDLHKMLPRVIGEDLELTMKLDPDLGRVKADSGQMEQVLMNLAVNARDAMPGGGKLTIETANVELDEDYARIHVTVTPGQYVMLSVSDTGVGMAPEVKERVFEPFFTTKEKGKGTGLGLSTVYGIVKQSGGNIWVYSELGGGTTFKIYLPRVDEPLEEVDKKEKGEVFPRGGETILVVEDEGQVRNVAVQILERQGYKVLEATHGMEALWVCEQHKGPIHLLMTDVVMPGMGGRELAQRLEHLYPGLKVLYMSGYTENAIVHHGVLEEGLDYLPKPFTMDVLTRIVRKVLNK